jgi:methylenetetrahydrofolate dehydrogenase (NADP+) / methenyltetrahydrofolate cyclohydrolase
MAALVLDGRKPAREIETLLAARVAALGEGPLGEGRGGGPPALAILLVGADPTSAQNARLKERACRRIGVEPLLLRFPERTATAEVLAEIDRLNADPRVHGIFLQHPVAGQVDERRCFDRIALAKDVGGDTSLGFGRMALGERAFPAATPAGILRLLAHYGIDPAGKEAVVVGRSPMVGKPIAMLLLAAHATVTICHSRTRDLAAVVRRAEVVVGAVGRPRLIQGDWIRDGAVVIDAGYHPGGAGSAGVGDIAMPPAAVERWLAYTPVPGGVGPMTLATLLAHTVEAAERNLSDLAAEVRTAPPPSPPG